MEAYQVPSEAVTFEEEIKKSRFITYLAPASGVDMAKLFIQQVKDQHPTARHHCWAFVAGAPHDSQQLGFSDDGEPSGTAGKPMLAQLMGSGVGEIATVVVRYYGGILLGTGGLVKAYGNGVQQALKILPTRTQVPQSEYQLVCDYPQLSMVEKLLQQVGGSIVRADYGANIQLVLSLPSLHIEQITGKLRDVSRGTLLLSPVE
ncbi:YigZ family protein [Pragia fontium]|uniref:YigZ family protein n=1 Tax=Pragia fontium TaxID=82985 RepID=A0ABQ5LPC6_9GAMM|nr:IMPACT family protein [Pragia fontium]GKX64493.1 YigZ family protein [Pragia fontium]